MKSQLVRLTTEDKLILTGLLFDPDQATDKVVLHVHGMAGNFYENRFLDNMAKVFTDQGWALFTINTRGHDYIADFPLAGEKEDYKRIGNAFEIFEDSIKDIQPAVDYLGNKPYKTIVLQGHSLGCSKAVYYLTQTKDSRIEKLVLASPADMIGIIHEEEHYAQLVQEAKQLITAGKDQQLLSATLWDYYYLSAKTYIDFSTVGNPIDIFNTHDKEAPSILAEVTIPTLAFFGTVDEAIILSPEETLDVIKSKAKNCSQFDTHIIPGAPHSYVGHEDAVANLIATWLTADAA